MVILMFGGKIRLLDCSGEKKEKARQHQHVTVQSVSYGVLCNAGYNNVSLEYKTDLFKLRVSIPKKRETPECALL